MLETKTKVYSIQVSNISCINCASAIKTILTAGLSDPDAKISINIMNQKVTLMTSKEQIPSQAIDLLNNTKYKPIGQPILISGNDSNQRTISFLLDYNPEPKQLEEILSSCNGIIRKELTFKQQKLQINVTYDCQVVKGRQIADIIQKYDKEFKVVNQRIDSLRKTKKSHQQSVNIKLTIALAIYFMFANMILPILPYFGSIYNECITFPQTFGIYSISVLFNISMTIYVMQKYASRYILRAYENYKAFRATNMQTLVALGSLSAFALFLFFIFRYTIDMVCGTIPHIHQAIMDINDSLTSASIIVLVVTIGKYLQSTVKHKIQRINDEIFPESVLFKNMSTTYVQIRNRKLIILSQKVYDVSLIEKSDIVRLEPGVLLFDVIVINGSVKVTQSARTGSEDVLTLGKGERIQSGSVIHQANDCLALVEKVIENSLLIQLLTHVKFAQNEDEGQASSLEVLCKKIADYFVRGVILLSITTMFIWTLILRFQLAKVPVCDVCWVIERGIGVLVASCPCALGLAIPSVIANILKIAIKSGILIKKTNVFEKIKKAKIISFDKTGTLFTKINHIEQCAFFKRSLNEEQIWQLLALLERDIRHPLAQIIYKQAFNRSRIAGTNFSLIVIQKQYIPSQGVKARLLNKQNQQQLSILIGNRQLLLDNRVPCQNLKREKESHTAIYLAIDYQAEMVMYINTHSNLRPEAAEVIRKLEQQGLEIHILSGDSRESVEKLGKNIGIAEQNLHPEYTATDKLKWIQDIQQNGRNTVIMVGDGLNDIPCLQEAGIGVSINAKSELNINAADVVILSENLYKILALVRFLNRGNLFIRMNLFWAFAYNVVIMPITAGALFPLDIFVSPVWSSIAMSCSSLIVVAFSHLLSFFSYDQSISSPKSEQSKSFATSFLTSSNREMIVLNEQIS